MSKLLKTSVLTMTLASFAFVAPLQATAGQRHHYNNGHQYKKYNYKRHYYRGNNRYSYRSRHRNRDNGGAIAFGVLTGGLLFYALSNNRRQNNTTYVQQAPVSAPPQQQTWVQPAPTWDKSCLQVREYTTTIVVGGKTVPAYGQACLQPDGSWKFGLPTAEPAL